jgi:ABC-type multidrug transport system ATPase subunit
MPDPAVHVEGVVKRFGATTALAGVDLDVEEGTIFALLGPNGAGKTTLVRILATLLAPDTGRAEVFGRDVARDAAGVREVVALTGQFAAIDEILTGRENLQMFGRLFDLSARMLAGGRTSCSSASSWLMRPTAQRARTPVGCGDVSTSHQACSRARACCS